MSDHNILEATVLVPGEGSGSALVLTEGLSLWGGLDPESGEITDRRHPASGEIVTDRVLVMPSGRGSSSASSILLEAVRAGTGPAAIILAEKDGILALGAAVAREMYGTTPPVVVLSELEFAQIQAGQWVSVGMDGQVMIQHYSDDTKICLQNKE